MSAEYCERCENTSEVGIYTGIGFPKAGWCPSCEPEKAEKYNPKRIRPVLAPLDWKPPTEPVR